MKQGFTDTPAETYFPTMFSCANCSCDKKKKCCKKYKKKGVHCGSCPKK